MNKLDWEKLIESLPEGLTQLECAKRLGRPNGSVRHWIKKLNYRFKDGRTRKWSESRREAVRTLNPNAVDWSQPNVKIAREHGVSRERVRQVRKQLGKERD